VRAYSVFAGRLPPPSLTGSPVVPPELQATKQSKGATERSWDRCFDQEGVRIARLVTSTPCRQARPSVRPEFHSKIQQNRTFLRSVIGSALLEQFTRP
jgi:hypothetical protein